MQFISEKERITDQARVMMAQAAQKISDACASGKAPDFQALEDARKLLLQAEAQPHICECFSCHREFEGDDTTHYTIVIYQFVWARRGIN
jgi:hypothetical protein